MGKVSTPSPSPLETGCQDYSFLDQTVEDFEHGLDSILTKSVKTEELDASFDAADTMPSSVSTGYLYLAGAISNISKPQLADSIKSCKLWCKARTLLLPVPWASKMSASKLTHYFSSHPGDNPLITSF